MGVITKFQRDKFSRIYAIAQLVDRLSARKVKKSEWKEQVTRLSWDLQPAHRVEQGQKLPRRDEHADHHDLYVVQLGGEVQQQQAEVAKKY